MSLSSLIENMLDRGVLSKFDDSGDTQSINIDYGYERKHEDVERLQDYGLTSSPPEDSQVFFVCFGGSTESPIAIKVDVPTKRPKLESGEVALWTVYENQISLKKDGSISAKSKNGATEIQLLSNGKISIKNGTVDVIEALATITQLISGATTATAIGPQPLSVAAQLAEWATKLASMKV